MCRDLGIGWPTGSIAKLRLIRATSRPGCPAIQSVSVTHRDDSFDTVDRLTGSLISSTICKNHDRPDGELTLVNGARLLSILLNSRIHIAWAEIGMRCGRSGRTIRPSVNISTGLANAVAINDAMLRLVCHSGCHVFGDVVVGRQMG